MYLEPYRRVLLGYWGGALVILSLASLLGLEKLTGGFLGILLAVAGGVIGAMLTSQVLRSVRRRCIGLRRGDIGRGGREGPAAEPGLACFRRPCFRRCAPSFFP